MGKDDTPQRKATAFANTTRFVSGSLAEVAIAVKAQVDRDPSTAFLVFDDESGEQIDLNLGGTAAEVIARLERRGAPPGRAVVPEADLPKQRGRGRPRLGVVAREVTLLPRHWQWLETQRGGASSALRRLVDDAIKASVTHDSRRSREEAAYRFMHAIAGDAEGFEEATRALFANDRRRLESTLNTWPADIRDYTLALAFRPSDSDDAPASHQTGLP